MCFFRKSDWFYVRRCFNVFLTVHGKRLVNDRGVGGVQRHKKNEYEGWAWLPAIARCNTVNHMGFERKKCGKICVASAQGWRGARNVAKFVWPVCRGAGASVPEKAPATLLQFLQRIGKEDYMAELAAGVRSGKRLAISQAITLCESSRSDHATKVVSLPA